MPYLLTKLERGDEERYDLYLRELKRFDLKTQCRRDFFKHMATVDQMAFGNFKSSGGFLRKYRPMFEAAVPAWAAKANKKLRATHAARRQEVIDAQRERVRNRKAQASAWRMADRLNQEGDHGDHEGGRGNQHEREDGHEHERVELSGDEDATEAGDDSEYHDHFSSAHRGRDEDASSPISPLSDDLRPSSSKRRRASSDEPIFISVPPEPSRTRRSQSSDSDIVMLDSPPATIRNSHLPTLPRSAGTPNGRQQPPPLGPMCEEHCPKCLHQGLLHVSHGRLRRMLHDYAATMQDQDAEINAQKAEIRRLKGKLSKISSQTS